MTPKQQELLSFIRDRIDQTGLAPTYSDILRALNLQSKSSVHRLITALIDQGQLIRTSGGVRNLRLPMPNLGAVPTSVLEAELARRERSVQQ